MATNPPAVSDPRNATIASGARAVQFATQNVQPPAPLLLQLEDQLLIKVTAPTIPLPILLNIEMRILRPDSTIVPMRIPVKVAATTFLFDTLLTEGFLLSITASMAAGQAAARGQVFVQAFIARNIATDIEIGWCLFSDYVSTNYHPSWPGTILKSPLEGPGNIYAFPVIAPGAGNDFNQAVPALTRWRIISIFATFTAAVAVANRFPNFSLALLAGVLYRGQAIAAITASTNAIIQGVPGFTYLPAAEAQLVQYIPIPPNTILTAGSFVSSFTPNMQGADTWTQITLNVEEWVDI